MCPPGEALAWTKVSTSHSDVSPASINVSPCATHLDAQDELINKTHQLARPRLWLSMMGLMVEVSDAGGKSIKKSSKSRRIVKKSKKPQRSEKFAKAIGSEERLPKHRSSVNEELELPLQLSDSFSSSFAEPRSFLDSTFGAIIDKAKVVGLLMLCRVFPRRSQENLRVENTRVFHQS